MRAEDLSITDLLPFDLQHGLMGMVARSPAMRQLMDLAQRVAQVDSTVLITGESGTGKERVARLVHQASTRRPGALHRGQLRRHPRDPAGERAVRPRRGAFTGAMQERPGLFEAANGGTLLLDEMGEISPAMQVKLLRVLQEREVRRVGESASPAHRRAGHRRHQPGSGPGDRRGPVPQGPLLPPERGGAAGAAPARAPGGHPAPGPAAARGGGLRLCRTVSGLSPRAADQLLRYPWPGNVRELENAMERAVALARTAVRSWRTCPRRSAGRCRSRCARPRCSAWRTSRRNTSWRCWT